MTATTPTKTERAFDLFVRLFGTSVMVNAGLASLDHHWRWLASIAFTLAGWSVACIAIETKRWAR